MVVPGGSHCRSTEGSANGGKIRYYSDGNSAKTTVWSSSSSWYSRPSTRKLANSSEA